MIVMTVVKLETVVTGNSNDSGKIVGDSSDSGESSDICDCNDNGDS